MEDLWSASTNTPLDPKESHRRSVLKATTYRALGSLTTRLLAYTVTGDFRVSVTIATLEPLVKTIL